MIKSVGELTKIVATELVKQSELDNSHILNGLSIRGPELVKYIEDSIEMSPDLSDTFIVFTLGASNKQNTFTEEVDDSINVRTTNFYNLHLYIYGSAAFQTSILLKARFESNYCSNNLNAQGVFIRNVGNPETTTELVNNTLWGRADLEMTIAAQMIISPVDSYENFEELGDNNIETN